jgi:RNA polymerase sigma factor (sigma-70 family)
MATNAVNTAIRHLRRAALRQGVAGLSDAALLGRYAAGRDEAAFEALLRRHGPMVLGVCRRVLGNEADAEDAFQATFLVLVRKAASIRSRGAVGSWLYGVAHNTARKAKAMRSRRRAKEREAGAAPRPGGSEGDWREAQALLEAELGRLPDKYRAVIVLCELEGQTVKGAARQLGCPQGTAATRLARGRALLARRLASRGLLLSGAAVGAALAQEVAGAGVPPALVLSTVQAATLFAAARSATGLISAPVAALTEGVLRTMLLNKLKIALVAPLVLVALGIGLSGLTRETRAAGPAAAAAKPAPPVRDEGNLKEMVLALEGRLWEAHRKQDLDTFKNLLADDFVGLDMFGKPYGKAGELDYVVKFRVLEYTMKDVRVVLLNATSAIVTYEIRYQVRPTNGQDVESTTRRVTAAWARRQGRWWYVYFEDKLAQKKGAVWGEADFIRRQDLEMLWKSGRLKLKPPPKE